MAKVIDALDLLCLEMLFRFEKTFYTFHCSRCAPPIRFQICFHFFRITVGECFYFFIREQYQTNRFNFIQVLMAAINNTLEFLLYIAKTTHTHTHPYKPADTNAATKCLTGQKENGQVLTQEKRLTPKITLDVGKCFVHCLQNLAPTLTHLFYI